MSEVDLKELHDLHLQLHDVQKSLRRGPKQIARYQQAIETRQQELQDAKQHLKDLQHTASVKNQDLQVLESKIVDLNVKLNAAKTNQEFDVFQRQIEADTTAKEVAEVEILETLERIDHQQGAVKKAEAAVVDAEAEAKEIAEKIAAAEAGLKRQEEELAGQVADREKLIPATVLKQYRRVVAVQGANCLSPVENKTCQACYTKLSPQHNVEVNTGKYLFCRSCGRLLYKA
ncbi:zinc ribbon domain-containing protein [Thalassoroseus pseudoceratinae]|uniref:zinc ribbon domain-containing protein n=1 Tax=Thalassoroseus pseudoceratinae TaxID=2713176 RepID=UPI00141E9FBC|nr:hypothetical protein [Thalassoroseus pseudoceratinae]